MKNNKELDINIIKNKILKLLSSNDVVVFDSGYAIHSKIISNILQINYEKIKMTMKEMKKEGLVVYENKSYRVCEDYEMQEYSRFRNMGWLLTDKARQTEIWKKEMKKEEKIFKECFGK